MAARSRTRLSDFTFTFRFHALEKAMATHSSVLTWRIPGTGKPGGLLSMGLHRVGHDWSDLAAAAVLHWRYAPHLLYLFIRQWAFRLFPCLGCCEQCCYKHGGACISLIIVLARYMLRRVGLLDQTVAVFWRNFILFFIVAAEIYIHTDSVGGFPFLHTLFSMLLGDFNDGGP